MSVKEEYTRTAFVLGEDAIEKLKGARVAVFGVGGVGGFVCESLARSGVGNIDIFDRDVVLRKIVYNGDGKNRIPAEYPSVGGEHNAEIVLFPVYPPRQNKQAVKHRKERTPLFDADKFKAFKFFGSVIFYDQGQVVSLLFERFDNFSYINRDTGLAVIKRNCRKQYFHNILSVSLLNFSTKISSEKLFRAICKAFVPCFANSSGSEE